MKKVKLQTLNPLHITGVVVVNEQEEALTHVICGGWVDDVLVEDTIYEVLEYRKKGINKCAEFATQKLLKIL